MARNRDEVFWPEDRGLLQDSSAYLGESEAMLGRVVASKPACLLDWLERDTTDAWLLQSKVYDASKFAFVYALLDRDDQRGRDTEFIEAFKGTLSYIAQIGSTELD